jgi:hypothetical protein
MLMASKAVPALQWDAHNSLTLKGDGAVGLAKKRQTCADQALSGMAA